MANVVSRPPWLGDSVVFNGPDGPTAGTVVAVRGGQVDVRVDAGEDTGKKVTMSPLDVEIVRVKVVPESVCCHPTPVLHHRKVVASGCNPMDPDAPEVDEYNVYCEACGVAGVDCDTEIEAWDTWCAEFNLTTPEEPGMGIEE